ncbi:glycosyltransferase [Clostridium sp. HCP1S3_B4]|uniref:glycosyltransferase n=1 Tax=unclassified Clostridium TaxID=2614128 RepID=UPI003F8B1F88
MKKVLEVFGEPISSGGQESYVMSTLKNMDLSGLRVDLFTPYYCDNQEYIDYMKHIGGKVVYADFPFKVGGTRREIIPCFESYLKKNEYDVVHIHSGSISVLAYYARVAAKQGIKKVIVHSHSSGLKENLKHFLIKMYASCIFKKYATDFCACSIDAAKWKFPKSVLPKVKIMNNGIDLQIFRFNPIDREKNRKKFGIEDDELVLGHVGRFTYEKNQSFLLEVLKEYIGKKDNIKVKLILVGDGIEIEHVKQKVIDLVLDNYVIFVGSSDKVIDYLQAMDVFLLPSLYEGLGIVGIEAQATGLQVIASERIPSTVKVTKNIHFASLNDINKWCDEIDNLKIAKRKDHSEEVRENGFDIVVTAKEVRKLYFD